MHKSYHMGTFAKSFTIIGLILVLYMLFDAYINKNWFWFIFAIIGIPISMYMVLAVINYRAIVSDNGLRIESQKFIIPQEIYWKDIYRVVDDSWAGIHIYHMIPQGLEKELLLINFIKDYRELLRDIAQNSPKAKIDESILRMIK